MRRVVRPRIDGAASARAIVLAATAATLTVLAPGCTWGPRPQETARADRLVVARAADAVSLDPAQATDIESLEVAEQVYGRLVRFTAGRLDPEPDLATSWSVSTDGTLWTFDLRPGVRFHDGTPFDAEAVVFSFERQLIPSHPAHQPDFLWTRSYRNIKAVRAQGPLRVQFEIDRPYAPFLANLAMGPAAIVSPTAVRRWGKEFGRHPVGTGPYRFVEWAPGDRLTLERNPDYWDQEAHTRYLVFLTMPDARQRLQALESGAADVMQQIPPEAVPLVRLDPELKLLTVSASLVSYLAINTQRHPLDDPRVRRAMAYALPHESLVRYIYQGLATSAVGPLPPNVWGARSDVVTYPYDPIRARRLIGEAKPTPSRPLLLFASPVPQAWMPAPEEAAESIKASFEDVGLPVEIVWQDPEHHQRSLWAGEHDLALHGWFSDNGDPDNFLYTLLDSDNTTGARPSNLAFYSSGWFHDLILQAQRLTDRTERERLYSQAQAIVAADVPWVPLAHPKVVFATRSRVEGLVVQPSSMALYRWCEVAR